MNRAQLREEIRRAVRDEPNLDTLNGALNDSATSFLVDLGTHAGAPQLIEIDSELLYASEYSSTTKTYTSVRRGHDGTTAASHTDGAVVRINPSVTVVEFNDAIKRAIERMNTANLFQVKTVTRSYNASVAGYDLASDVLQVYEVRARPPGSSLSWPEIKSYEVARNMPTTDFASGNALLLHQAGYSGQDVRIRYKAAYSQFSDDNADSSTLGIQTYAEDLIIYGAAAHLLAFREIERAQLESAVLTQRGQDVPPRHFQSIAMNLDGRFLERVREVRRRLRTEYPPRMRMG